MTGQQKFGRARGRSRLAKGCFCVVFLCFPVLSRARLLAGKGSQWGGFNRPNPITITQSRLVIHHREFPGARLAALCSARGMAQTLCFSHKLAGRAGASATRKRAAPRFGTVFYSLPRGWRPHKTQALASLFARIALSTVEYRVLCNMLLRRTQTEGPLVCCARSDVWSRHPTPRALIQ